MKLSEMTKYREYTGPDAVCTGMRLRNKDGQVYILAHVDDFKMTLVNVVSGRRWTNPHKVENTSTLTKKEIELLTGHLGLDGWELVEEGTP